MRIKLKVKTNSGKQKVEKVNDKEYKINLKSEPENNKANIELLRLLKKYFKEYKNIKIIRGLKNKEKLIKID
jgi:uncharacterized protein (TIGR00251 family)